MPKYGELADILYNSGKVGSQSRLHPDDGAPAGQEVKQTLCQSPA